MKLVQITAVTPDVGKLSLPATDHGYSRKFITEPGLYFEMEDGTFFVPASLLRAKLAELDPPPAPLLPPAPPAPLPLPPEVLWKQVKRMTKRYETTLIKHGYLLPLIPPPKRRRR